VTERKKVVVVGLGEIGKPLFELVAQQHEAVGVDLAPPASRVERPDFMHVCYPFQIRDFVGETARYIELLHPAVTIINSTVSIGITRTIAERTGVPVVNSPVRGKHARMVEDLRRYIKFVGAIEPEVGRSVVDHFESFGLKAKLLSSPEATELAKLTETTYFGLMIAWAQEVERYCDRTGQNYEEIVSFYDEIGFFPPVKYFPGTIGGHCVMPNIEILRNFEPSQLLDAIRASNEMKKEREAKREIEAIA